MNDPEMTVTLLTGEPEFRILRRGERCGLVRGDDALVAGVRQFIDSGRLDVDESIGSSPDHAFCVVERDNNGRLAISLAGAVVIELDDGTRLEARPGQVSRALAEGEVTVWSAAVPNRPQPDDDSDFAAGSIRGAGFVARTSGSAIPPPPVVTSPAVDPPPGSPPPVTAPGPVVPPPPAERDFQVFSLTADPDPAPPPPPTIPIGHDLVEGVRCSREHFNDPRSRYCSVCGISMLQTSVVIERAERPALGVLIFVDGSHETVDVPLIIGREPDETRVNELRGRAVVLADPNKRLSRVHAVVDLDGWDAVVRDDGSTNGTFVWRRDNQSWSRLATNQRHVLVSGDRVAFADVVVTFESGHQRS